jgi:adiponectin receptor
MSSCVVSGHLWDAKSIVIRQLPTGEQLAFGMFYIGGLLCLLASATFHTFCNHSESVSRTFNQLDYVGIVALISGSHQAAIYYAFYCHTFPYAIYAIAVAVLGSASAASMLIKTFVSLRYRTVRAVLFLMFGLCGIIPMGHILIVDGVQHAVDQCALKWMIVMGLFYVSGVIIYITQVPERLLPGQCDFLINSHQIFHVLVVGGIWLFYNGLLAMAEYRQAVGPCLE